MRGARYGEFSLPLDLLGQAPPGRQARTPGAVAAEPSIQAGRGLGTRRSVDGAAGGSDGLPVIQVKPEER